MPAAAFFLPGYKRGISPDAGFSALHIMWRRRCNNGKIFPTVLVVISTEISSPASPQAPKTALSATTTETALPTTETAAAAKTAASTHSAEAAARILKEAELKMLRFCY